MTFLPVEGIKELQEPGIYVAVMSQPGRFRYEYQVTYFYVSDIGPLNQVVHMWGYDSHEERTRRRALLAAAPEWSAFVPKVLPLIRDMENRILVPAPFAAVETLDWAGPQLA